MVTTPTQQSLMGKKMKPKPTKACGDAAAADDDV
jgi:hypothetical protein